MELRPGSHAHRPIARSLAAVLDGGLGPCLRIFGVQLRAVTTRAAGLGWRSYRIGIEAAPRAQTDEGLYPASFEPLLHLHGIVAGVENEQRDGDLILGEPVD
jgi:hypothetical protein